MIKIWAVLLILIVPPWGFAYTVEELEAISATLPDKWKVYLSLDLQFTTEKERYWQTRVFHFANIRTIYKLRVPKKLVTVIKSKYVDAYDLQTFDEDGDSVSLYVIKDAHIPNSNWLIDSFPVVEKLYGYWITSKSTYFVWNPAKQSQPPFFIKTELYWKEGKTTNNSQMNTNAVVTAEALEHAISAKGSSAVIDVYHERIAINFNDGVQNYSILIRTFPQWIHQLTDDEMLVPLHGVNGFAQHWGVKNLQGWIAVEYLPKLARATAELAFRYGVYLENHTQNISLVINKKTGEIKKFIFKDLADAMVDVFNQSLNGISLSTYREAQPMGLVNTHIHIVGNPSRSVEPGFYLEAYTGEAISNLNRDYSRSNTFRFLTNFINSSPVCAEEPLSMWESRMLSELKKGYPVSCSVRIDSERPLTVTDRHAAMALISQSIIVASNEKLFAEKLKDLELDFSSSSQGVMGMHFKEATRTTHISWLSIESKRNYIGWPGFYSYAYDGQGIYAFNRWTKKPIGYAYGLSDEVLAKLNALFPQTQQKFQCTQFFQP